MECLMLDRYNNVWYGYNIFILFKPCGYGHNSILVVFVDLLVFYNRVIPTIIILKGHEKIQHSPDDHDTLSIKSNYAPDVTSTCTRQ